MSVIMLLFAWVAAAAPPCATPQDAALSIFAEPSAPGAEEAGPACFDVAPEGLADRAVLAATLKQVLDARGLFLAADELPADPDHRDESGRLRVLPVPSLPELAIVKVGDQWLWSRRSVASIPELHAETFSPLLLGIQRALPPLFHQRFGGLFLWQYVYVLVLATAAVLVGSVVPLVVQRFAMRSADRIGVPFVRGTVGALRGPATWLAGGLVLAWGIPDLQLGVDASWTLRTAAAAMTSVAGVLVAVRLVDVAAAMLAHRASRTSTRLDDQFVPLAMRGAKAGVVALGVVVVLQSWGVDVGGLVAGLGIGGLAVALAAKDTLSNFFGSVTLFTDRPFQVGDWIVVDGLVEGNVEEVGFRSTRIRTFPDSVVTIPNGKVADARIDNLGQRRRRRLRVVLALTYDTPVPRLHAYVEAVRAALRAHPKVHPGQIEVHLHELGASSLDVLVYLFLEARDWHEELEARAELLARFLELAEEVGVAFAFPSTSLYVERLPPQA